MSRYSVNPAASRASVRKAKRRVRQNLARSNIVRILLCCRALAGDSLRADAKSASRRAQIPYVDRRPAATPMRFNVRTTSPARSALRAPQFLAFVGAQVPAEVEHPVQ